MIIAYYADSNNIPTITLRKKRFTNLIKGRISKLKHNQWEIGTNYNIDNNNRKILYKNE